MHITAVCPRCESRFQVDEGLRGKRMRCPNPLCRTVFEVKAGEDKAVAETALPPEPAKPEKPPAPVTGSLTDLIALLPAELADPAPPAPPPKAPAKTPRPPISVERPPDKPANAPAEPTFDFPDDFPGDDVAAGAVAVADGSREMGPGTWEAPPIRGAAIEPAEAPPIEPPPFQAPPAELPVYRSRRWPLLVIAVMTILLAGTIAVGWWVVEGARADSEADQFKRAQELYDRQDLAEAHEVLHKLIRDFPASPGARKYRFLAELSGVRNEADAARELAELKSALDHVLQFTGFNQNDPLLKDRHADVWQTLRRLAEQLAAQADKQHDLDALDRARKAWTEAEKFQPPPKVSAAEVREKMTKDFAGAQLAIETHQRRLAVLEALQKRVERPSAVGVQESRALATAAGLNGDAEVVSLLAEMVQAHRAAVKYEPATADGGPEASVEDALPGILVVPPLTKAKAGTARGRVALALARGVLYALDPVRGDLRWARRVGIDTSVLPLHVPADPITPELVLVLSSDNRTVSALVADTGAIVWRRGLDSPCTGQPVLVGRSLLVPTLAGQVAEVEISAGRLLGHYQLGQRLTVGGAVLEGSSLVYFPGDEFCVYVLDVAKRTCEAVLYSNHPAGSLRGVPILLRGRPPVAVEKETGKGPTGWMLLCQAKGTGGVEVRPFELPIREADQPAGTPTLNVPGLSWFAPWHDAEKLALATDAGLLSLWGIRQKGNRDDPLLFPLLKEHYAVANGGGPSRAQVVHADADGYWVLSGGRLHRLDAVFRPQSGPDLVSAWPQPPELGSPLHAAQHHLDAGGRSTLLLTTLALGRPTCLCTAVDSASGQFHWQRQLGCVPLHPLAVVGGQVLLRDATGLLLLDPARFPDQPEKPWQRVDDFLEREPLGPGDNVVLLSGASEWVQVIWSNLPAAARKIHIRHIPVTGAGTSKTYDLPAALAGTPTLGNGFVLLPLADGVAVRLDFGAAVAAGPNWRAAGADEQAPGHVVAMGGDEFLLTDGSRGLSRVSWSSAKVHERRARTELGHRIVAAPAVLPAVADARPRVCVADASDTLTLLDGERLQVQKRWPLLGKITAGPFVRGALIVCIVDHKRLVGIDPEGADPWEYTMVSNVVGAPLLVEGMLVAADVSGQFLALDPQKGTPLGTGYTVKANAAPDAAPAPFGPGRLLVPLNDGTLLLLPLARLRVNPRAD